MGKLKMKPAECKYKETVAMFKKDMATLSEQLQCILLRIQQYKIYILQMSRPELYPVYC